MTGAEYLKSIDQCYITENTRISELGFAISHTIIEGAEIPPEWVSEYNGLIQKKEIRLSEFVDFVSGVKNEAEQEA